MGIENLLAILGRFAAAIKYLKDNDINFVMRLPKHHLIQRQDGSICKIESLNSRTDRPLILKGCLVDGVVADVWVKELSDGDFLYLLGTVNAEFMAGPPVRTTLC